MLLWLWFGVVALLALGVAVLLAMSGCARDGASRLTSLGVVALLVAILPQFYSYLALTQYLDNAVGATGCASRLKCASCDCGGCDVHTPPCFINRHRR